MKYCLGCEFLRYHDPEPGYSTEYTADIGKQDAALACQLGHWRHEFDCCANVETVERAMRKAETCKDYEERSPPK